MEPERKATIAILMLLAAAGLLTGLVCCQGEQPAEARGTATRDRPSTATVANTARPAEKGEGAGPPTPTPGKPTTRTAAAKRQWAEPLKRPGLPNLHKVTDGLYRGAQPTAEGMRELKKMGVRTVVSLRSFHSDRDEIGDSGLGCEHIHMKPWHPEDKEVVRFLQTVTDKSRMPVFVHCQHGADRTGLVCAVYRVVVCGWTKDEAIGEMMEGGFGYHAVWINIPPYLRKLNINTLKQQAGLVSGTEEQR